MTRYLFEGNEVDLKHFDKALENAIYKECDDENFCNWIDDYYAPHGIEIGNATFYASNILYKMDKEEYNKQKEAYTRDQLEAAWDELEQGGFIIVADFEFEIQREE